ncbi:MAG TPA: DUF177 domain-containing protein [Propionibacteriaceae bacterium]|nr:DUF177 domain-containing protein [Propionibacteriaceae bacterium]HPZ48863.1 DUF177 domain-containing protein [Propionibacteriaceae bacterium]
MGSHHRLPDPRSGLVIEVHDLSRQAGTMREVRRTTEAPGEIGIGVIGVPAGSPIELDVRLESVGEGVLVTGSAEVTLTGECARCLTPIRLTDEVDIQELYYYPGNGPDDEETSRIEGERIDLEPVLRDTVVLDLPFTPLCRDDCEGLCQICGANLNDDPEHGHDDGTDDRWSSLSGWQSDDTK